eukprot:scaffold10190_cov294-Chaetoceros_neogracile.AAC.4
MAKLKLSSSPHNIFILSDSTESNPYKNRNERSRCIRTDNYDEEISSDNAKAWDAFVDEWGKVEGNAQMNWGKVEGN